MHTATIQLHFVQHHSRAPIEVHTASTSYLIWNTAHNKACTEGHRVSNHYPYIHNFPVSMSMHEEKVFLLHRLIFKISPSIFLKVFRKFQTVPEIWSSFSVLRSPRKKSCAQGQTPKICSISVPCRLILTILIFIYIKKPARVKTAENISAAANMF